ADIRGSPCDDCRDVPASLARKLFGLAAFNTICAIASTKTPPARCARGCSFSRSVNANPLLPLPACGEGRGEGDCPRTQDSRRVPSPAAHLTMRVDLPPQAGRGRHSAADIGADDLAETLPGIALEPHQLQ